MSKGPPATLREVDFDSAALGDEARGLMRGSMTPIEYVDALKSRALFEDAFVFLAHWLPKPAAIWWGTLCAWLQYRPAAAKPVAHALSAVVGWLQQPGEERRRAAETAADTSGADTPAGMLALAVFYSGGSISLPEAPVVEPPPFMTAQYVANAVIMTADQTPAAGHLAAKQNFVHMALEISEGKNLWMPTPA